MFAPKALRHSCWLVPGDNPFRSSPAICHEKQVEGRMRADSLDIAVNDRYDPAIAG